MDAESFIFMVSNFSSRLCQPFRVVEQIWQLPRDFTHYYMVSFMIKRVL